MCLHPQITLLIYLLIVTMQKTSENYSPHRMVYWFPSNSEPTLYYCYASLRVKHTRGQVCFSFSSINEEFQLIYDELMAYNLSPSQRWPTNVEKLHCQN